MRFLLAVAWVLLAWVQGGRASACEGAQQSTAWLRAVASEADATSFAQLGWNFSINAKSKLFDHDPCKERWPRVGCDATTGCLVSLNLSRLPLLDSQLPPSIFTLSSLQSLDAIKSGLTTWSAAAVNLSQALSLARLDLGHNSLPDLPSTLYAATSLTYLDLSNNCISGTLSSAIGALSRLKYLDLGANFNLDKFKTTVNGTLPETLPVSLEHINLSFCSFGPYLPSSLFTLTSLTFLDLSFGSYSGTLSSDLGKLSRMQVLNLNDNSLRGAIPSTRLASLRSLSLGTNMFRGKLPAALLNNALTYLELSYNSLTALPTEIGTLNSLVYLSVSINPSLSSLPSQLFGLTSLRSLSLEGLKNNLFSHLKNGRTAYFSYLPRLIKHEPQKSPFESGSAQESAAAEDFAESASYLARATCKFDFAVFIELQRGLT